MKRFATILLVAFASCAFAFAGGASESADSSVLRVGASPEPHGTLLNLVVDDLAQQGITLEIVEFTDYVMPNEALQAGEIDANYFQHLPYLESFNLERGFDLVSRFPTVRPSRFRTTRPTRAGLSCCSNPPV